MTISYTRGHISALDGIRGIAILLVLFFHCFENVKIFPFNIISEIGWVGVDLFFVLSGFLITGILVDTNKRDNYFTAFIAKRALRILPLYYLCLLIAFITVSLPGAARINPVLDPRHLESAIYYLTFTQNLYFSYNGWGITDLLNHFWSLAVEEQFYLFWPVIIYYLSRSQVLLVCGLLIITSLIVRNSHAGSDFSYVFTFARVDALAIGAAIAIIIRENSRLLDRIALPVFSMSLSVLLLISVNSTDLHFRNPYFVRLGYTIFALLFGCVIAFVFDSGPIGKSTNKVLSIRLLTFFGTYSYGLYIYHWLLYKGVYLPLKAKYALSEFWTIPF